MKQLSVSSKSRGRQPHPSTHLVDRYFHEAQIDGIPINATDIWRQVERDPKSRNNKPINVRTVQNRVRYLTSQTPPDSVKQISWHEAGIELAEDEVEFVATIDLVSETVQGRPLNLAEVSVTRRLRSALSGLDPLQQWTFIKELGLLSVVAEIQSEPDKAAQFIARFAAIKPWEESGRELWQLATDSDLLPDLGDISQIWMPTNDSNFGLPIEVFGARLKAGVSGDWRLVLAEIVRGRIDSNISEGVPNDH